MGPFLSWYRIVPLLAAISSTGCGQSPKAQHSAGGSGNASVGGGDGDGGNAASGAGPVATGGALAGGGAAGGGSTAAACPLPRPPVLSNDPTEFPAAAAEAPSQHHYFRIDVKSAVDGAPLRGARLRTVNEIDLVSDDNGVVAFYEPGLMGKEVYFYVSHPGYELAADAFGYHGKALVAEEGTSAELRLSRTSGALAPVQGTVDSQLVQAPAPGPSSCFALRLYDAETQRGVPLVRVTAFGESYWSDSQGIVAYCRSQHLPAPGATLEIWSHGYELAGGATSVSVDLAAGGRKEIPIERRNLAERLYRLTGGGIYRDSVILGLETPLAKPTLNASILGQDTASTTVYRGKLFWIWQDTERASYPLGNFKGTSAWSTLPIAQPDRGVDLDYIENAAGFSAEMCADCPGGPAWLDGLFSAPDAAGEERLFGGYAIVASDSQLLETGIVRFDDASQRFERVVTDFQKRPGFERPSSHPFEFWHAAERYAYYANRLRIPAHAEAFVDSSRYERFTPFSPSGELQKSADGAPDYTWRPDGAPATSARLTNAGLGAEQSLDGHLMDVGSGAKIDLIGVSTTYHPYEARFLLIGQKRFGAASALGDIWQAQADTPMGPWLYAVQLIAHDDYTFYNVLYHPELARGSLAYFEGTYTATYSGGVPTPRYDYNQLLYRVDLARPEAALPVAVYALPAERSHLGTKRELRPGERALAAAFFAYTGARDGTLAIAATDASCRPEQRLELTATPKTAPLFYALPPGTAPGPGRVALHEWTHADGRHAYAPANASMPAGFMRQAAPLAWVLENPVRVRLPVADYLPRLLADAGPDQCLAAAGSIAHVTLDAASSRSAGRITRYLWRIPGRLDCELVEGARVELDLPPGIYAVELELTDDAGGFARDSVTISIR